MEFWLDCTSWWLLNVKAVYLRLVGSVDFLEHVGDKLRCCAVIPLGSRVF